MSNVKYKKTANDTTYINSLIKPGTSSVITLNKTKDYEWGYNTGSNFAYALGQIFSADFTVTPTINAALKSSDGCAHLDGLTVLTFTFGV